MNKTSRLLILGAIIVCQTTQSFALTSEECAAQKGVVSSNGCAKGHNIGAVTGLRCPCICCVGETVVDCKINYFEILSVCDSGHEIRYQFKRHGKFKPKSVTFNLSGNGGRRSLDGNLDTTKKEQRISYGDASEKQNFNKIEFYRVEYEEAPLSSCNFLSDEISPGGMKPVEIKPCK